ncbi:hypothetical protein [Desulforamulus putei]|uniref:hypothetical protein n=1 Tax=Desulforamulus putei TaxID=74701 RepID=UPI0009322C31|nr:hypothetical protein [Desulforamulus putei]
MDFASEISFSEKRRFFSPGTKGNELRRIPAAVNKALKIKVRKICRLFLIKPNKVRARKLLNDSEWQNKMNQDPFYNKIWVLVHTFEGLFQL